MLGADTTMARVNGDTFVSKSQAVLHCGKGKAFVQSRLERANFDPQ